MRAILGRVVVATAIFAGTVVVAPAANANDMDPVLSRMWHAVENNDGTFSLQPRDDLFDGLAMELAMAIAPSIMTPAETLGWSGFFMGLEATLTIINQDALHMRCGVENYETGHGGNGACDLWTDHVDGALFVPAIHVRKGLPYSFELGLQIQYVANTELVALGGEIRWAPFEGFRSGWMGYLPDIAFRFTGNYLMGSNELALGMVGGDVSISYPFTISGQMTMTPYFGWQFFVVGADHEQVLNSAYLEHGQDWADQVEAQIGGELRDPNNDTHIRFHDGESRNFGQALHTLKFHRLFLGVRILWERLAITPQLAIAMPINAGAADTDDIGTRFQLSLSVGTDF